MTSPVTHSMIRAVLFGLIGLCLGCAGQNTPISNPPTLEEEDTELERENYYGLGNFCASEDFLDSNKCRMPKFCFEITENEKQGENNENTNLARAGYKQGAYNVLWGKPGAKYRWRLRIKPDRDPGSARQFRYVLQDDLPSVIDASHHSHTSERISFDVNLEDPITDDSGDEDVEVPIREWVSKNKTGNIELEVQDVSYCEMQNRINSDVSNNQKDCSDTSGNYFRAETLTIEYDLDFDGAQHNFICRSENLVKETLDIPILNTITGIATGLANKKSCNPPRTEDLCGASTE